MTRPEGSYFYFRRLHLGNIEGVGGVLQHRCTNNEKQTWICFFWPDPTHSTKACEQCVTLAQTGMQFWQLSHLTPVPHRGSGLGVRKDRTPLCKDNRSKIQTADCEKKLITTRPLLPPSASYSIFNSLIHLKYFGIFYAYRIFSTNLPPRWVSLGNRD